MTQSALIIIDLQNDYFLGGAFPLAQVEETLCAIESAIKKAQAANMPIVLVQHVANPATGIAPFFNQDTEGVKIHPRILAAAPHAPIVIKHFADSFEKTTLHETLQALHVDELILCGMMTQNCVTNTALSRQADAYKNVSVLTDASTTVSEILHLIALNALSTRVTLGTVNELIYSLQNQIDE